MIEYELIRSRRRSLAAEITGDRKLLIRAPMHISKKEIEKFILKHEKWIQTQMARPPMRTFRSLDAAEKRELLALIAARTEHYAPLMNVTFAGLRIGTARRRWGSCSAKNRLSFSEMLADMPPEAIDAIVVHELAHIRYKNHSREFYAFIESVLPDYRARMRLLREKSLAREDLE